MYESETVGKIYICQVGTAAEGTVTNDRHARRDVDMDEVVAMGEEAGRDMGERGGEVSTGEACAAFENASTDVGDAVVDGDFGNIFTAFEGFLADGLDRESLSVVANLAGDDERPWLVMVSIGKTEKLHGIGVGIGYHILERLTRRTVGTDGIAVEKLLGIIMPT